MVEREAGLMIQAARLRFHTCRGIRSDQSVRQVLYRVLFSFERFAINAALLSSGASA